MADTVIPHIYRPRKGIRQYSTIKYYGISSGIKVFLKKIVSTIQKLYDGFTCQVIYDRSFTDPFPVSTGVWQGWLLSPLIFYDNRLGHLNSL